MGGEPILTLGSLSPNEPLIILGRRKFQSSTSKDAKDFAASSSEKVSVDADDVFEPVSDGNYGKKISSPIFQDPDEQSYLIDQLSDGEMSF